MLLNQGRGRFVKEGDYFVGSDPTGLFAGDLDHDGDVDVAVSNGGSDEVSILFNRTDPAITLVEDHCVGFSPEPEGFRLDRSYPNPFNAETTISYYIPETSTVRLSIYALTGQLIRTLVDREHPAGRYSVLWDGRNDAGQDVSSGVYLYRLNGTDRGTETKKMVLMR